jgi:spermidine synthase
MLPQVRPRRALVLGLGGGTLPQLLLQRFGQIPITGIDNDPRVIELATSQMGLDPQAVSVVCADAFEWVSKTSDRFDYVAIDLYRGGEVPRKAFSTKFLRDVRHLLVPGGALTVNLAQDNSTQERLDRLSRLFRIVQACTAGKNIVVHARVRRR